MFRLQRQILNLQAVVIPAPFALAHDGLGNFLDGQIGKFVQILNPKGAAEDEEANPTDVPSGDVLAREFQRFLRQRGPDQ